MKTHTDLSVSLVNIAIYSSNYLVESSPDPCSLCRNPHSTTSQHAYTYQQPKCLSQVILNNP